VLRNAVILITIAVLAAGCMTKSSETKSAHDGKELVYTVEKQIRCTVHQQVDCDISSTLGIRHITVTLHTAASDKKAVDQNYRCVRKASLQWDPIVPYSSMRIDECKSTTMPSNFAVAVYGNNEMRRVLVGTADYAGVPTVAKSHWGCGPESSTPFLPCNILQGFCALAGGNYNPEESPTPADPSHPPSEPSASCELPEWPQEPAEPGLPHG
jgi:hypothetical protein